MKHQAFIALGSNLNNPQAQIEQALHTIANTPKIKLIKASSLYKTVPIGYDNQPDFMNAVAEIETELTPLALLHAMLDIENQHGRERPFPNAPRVLDLDVLLYEDIFINTPELTIPHPRMHLRGFVMLPLAEIAPKINIGNHGYADVVAAKCDNQGVSKP
jgi:2-amino-4-hydroxy-6-hydroxymethyldihydropteridine diphosphokinase